MASNTAFKEHAEITLSDNTVLELGPGDFTVSGNYVVDGPGLSSFPLGVAVQRQAQLQIMNADGGFSDVDFLNASVRLYLTLGNEELGLGYFTATTPATYGDTITVTVYDDMYKADKEYAAGITFPATTAALFADVCSCCGITAGGTFKNSTFTVNATPPSGMTCREVLGGIGLIAAGNVHIDDSGVAQVVSYTTTSTPPELSLWQTISVETADTVITGLSTEGSTGSVQVGSGDYILPVSCAAFPTQEQDILTLIGVGLLGLTFRVFTGEHIANPLIEFMDYVSVKDRKGVSHRTFITDAQFQFCNFTSLKNSAATSVDNGRTYSSVQRTVNNIRSQVQRLDDQITSKVWQEDIDEASSEIEQKIDNITLRVIGSDGTVSEIAINDQGQINLLGTVIAQKMDVDSIQANSIAVSKLTGEIRNSGWVLDLENGTFTIGNISANKVTSGALTVKDSNGNVLFSADKDNKTVTLAGWTATNKYLSSKNSSTGNTISLGNGEINANVIRLENSQSADQMPTMSFYPKGGSSSMMDISAYGNSTAGYSSQIYSPTDIILRSPTGIILIAGTGSGPSGYGGVGIEGELYINGTTLSSLLSGKAPTSHAVNANTYGLGTTGVYGHVKTVNNVTTSAHASGLALSAYQGKVLKDAIDALNTRTDSTITVASGWTATQKWCRKRAGIVEFYLEITGGTLSSGWNTVGTLPSGYRPPAAFDDVVLNNGSTTDPASQMKVQADGSIRVYKVAATTNNLRLRAVFST